MKLIKITFFSLLLAMLTIMACSDDFLDVAPTGSLGDIELSSKDGLEGVLTSSYSMLLGRSGFYSDASNWFWGSVLGGDANKGTNAGDQSQVNEIQAYNAQTTNESVQQKYRALYEGIARANAALKLLQNPDPTVPPAIITRFTAEARFLRGHYYFELKKIFNNTPYVDEDWDREVLVSNAADLWPFIEADFQFAKDNLPAEQADAGRANSWAAASYLGKAYLFQGKYAEAKVLFDDIIANGVTASGDAYDLVPNYANVFRATNDNNEESIFSVQAAANTGSVNNANPAMVLNFPHGAGAPGGCCGFNQPSMDLVNSFRTDVSGLPFLDGTYNDAANKMVSDLGTGAYTVWTDTIGYHLNEGVNVDIVVSGRKISRHYKSLTGGSAEIGTNLANDPLTSPTDWELTWEEGLQSVDPRLDHSVGRRGIPYLDWGDHPGVNWIRDQPYAGPYAPKKFIYYKAGNGVENDLSSWTPGYTTVNYNVIRFADVLLMAAEADIELGNLGTALVHINRVRTRAANSLLQDGTVDAANYVINNYTAFASQDEARTALRFERKLELSGEGHRFYDLVRWGIAANTLNAYLAHEDAYLKSPFAGASFTAGTNEYLPIPQSEIDLQGSGTITQNPGY